MLNDVSGSTGELVIDRVQKPCSSEEASQFMICIAFFFQTCYQACVHLWIFASVSDYNQMYLNDSSLPTMQMFCD